MSDVSNSGRNGASSSDAQQADAERAGAPSRAPGRPLGAAGRPGIMGGGHPGRMATAKPKQLSATLRRLWGYFGRERKGLLLILVLVVLSAALMVAGPLLIGMAIDAIADGDLSLMTIVVVALAGAFVIEGLLVLVQGWLMAGLSQRVVKRLREALFGKLQKLPLSYYDARPHGEVMSRLTNDIDNVSMTISQSTIQMMSGTLTVIGSLVMMLVLSPLLTLAALVTVPLVFGLVHTITKRTRLMFKEQQAKLGELNGLIEETITGQEMVKAFNHEAQSISQFEHINKQLYTVSYKAQVWSGFMMPLLGVINNIGFAAVAFFGGVLAVQGAITVGIIASFVGYLRQFVRPLNELAQVYNMLLAGVAGAERAFEVLDAEQETGDRPGAVELIHPKGHIVFENVSFGYRPDALILKNVSFEAMPGDSMAFVGQTGAGKTTIINLLTRFYDVTEGRILLDGRDLRDYTRASLRRCFGIVLQDTYLFSGTVRDNIRYGRPEATDEEVMAAAKLANAHEFIMRLKEQYDTRLSENGGNLSQGQRQLLAIARVILAQPSILILDEATSSIDTRTELQLQAALLELMKARTSFIIAHRLNTIRDADQIVVMQQGEIAEAGDHETLLARKGAYYGMFRYQFAEAK